MCLSFENDDCAFLLCSRVMSEVRVRFKPSAVVCQCGVDTLAGDPMASFNLTQHGIGECVRYLMEWNLPLLLLGGGELNCHHLIVIKTQNYLPCKSCNIVID